MGARVYRFHGFKLDCDRFELLQDERSLKLERKPMELLILLATKKDCLVTRAEIAEQLWKREVFVDTEHGINTAVRKIRQVLKDDSEQPRFVQTVTGKGYRFISPLEEEWGPDETGSDDAKEGQNRATLVEVFLPEDGVAVRTVDAARIGASAEGAAGVLLRRWIWFGVVVAGIGMLLTFAGRHRWSGGRGRIRSVAVLPLENLTGDAGQDYIADGMTDELTTMLAKSSTLRVTSRTSVLQYKGAHRPLQEIARQLGVDGVLEGSVRRVGDKLHMTIQLIEASNDVHVWAESYDRDADGLVSLPKEAARAIAQQLNSAVPQQRLTRYVNPEAHDAYMRGHYLWFTDHTREAGPYFKQATELQPDYALGWSGLAIYYGASAVKGELSPAESLPQTNAAATRAVELDDSLPEAHLAMAGAQMAVRWDLARAEAETLRAVELEPKFAEAHHLRAKILAAQNRHAEAIEAQRRATELDPFTRPWAMALAYMEARQFDAALKEANEKRVAFPENAILLWLIHVIYERKGMQAESVNALEKSLSIEGHDDQAKDLRSAYSTDGYKGVLRWKMKRAEDRSRSSYVSPIEIADLAAKLGERQLALALLEEAYRQRATALLWMQTDPAFDSLHGEERYRSIVRGVGLPAAF